MITAHQRHSYCLLTALRYFDAVIAVIEGMRHKN